MSEKHSRFCGFYIDPECPAEHDGPEDWCSLCGGDGCEYGCGHKYGGCQSAHVGPYSHRVCRKCKGSGRDPIPPSLSTEEKKK